MVVVLAVIKGQHKQWSLRAPAALQVADMLYRQRAAIKLRRQVGQNGIQLYGCDNEAG